MNHEERVKKFKEAHEKGEEFHGSPTGKYIGDFVYGANDGIITTFAVVSAVAGASLQPFVVLIIGFANLLADGFSMAIGNYLGTKSEIGYYKKERETEEWEVDNLPEEEKKEIKEIYRAKGFTGEILEKVVDVITKDKKIWVDTMMREELNMSPIDNISPVKKGLATFVAFIIAGFMPLVPYLFKIEPYFQISVILTGVTLFLVGAARTKFTGSHWLRNGLEMLIVGALAAIVAYTVGWLLSGFA